MGLLVHIKPGARTTYMVIFSDLDDYACKCVISCSSYVHPLLLHLHCVQNLLLTEIWLSTLVFFDRTKQLLHFHPIAEPHLLKFVTMSWHRFLSSSSVFFTHTMFSTISADMNSCQDLQTSLYGAINRAGRNICPSRMIGTWLLADRICECYQSWLVSSLYEFTEDGSSGAFISDHAAAYFGRAYEVELGERS